MHVILDPRTPGYLDAVLRFRIVREFLEKLRRHDRQTAEHSVRVGALSLDIAAEYDLSDAILMSLGMAGVLHDIGKLQVSHDPRALFVGLERTVPVQVRRWVASHHEWRSNGYRHHYPLQSLSQVIAAADIYDALASDRPHEKAMAFADLERDLATQFRGSRALVQALLRRHPAYVTGSPVSPNAAQSTQAPTKAA